MVQQAVTDLTSKAQAMLKGTASNIAQSQVGGGKEETQFLIQGSSVGGIASTKLVSMRNMTAAPITQTGVDSDLAVEGGRGMVVVEDDTGQIGYTDFVCGRVSQTGILETPDGGKIKAWALNANGERPSNYASSDSFVNIDLSNSFSAPVPTENVEVEGNLNVDTQVFRGPGSTINLKTAGAANALTSSSIIEPGKNGTAALKINDTFTMTPIDSSNPNGTTYTFEYGVICSREISPAYPMYTATGPDVPFNVLNAGETPSSSAEIKYDQGIRMWIGSQKFEYFVSGGSTGVKDGKFNTLKAFADAIRAKSNNQADARVISGRLYILPKDPNAEVYFEDIRPPSGLPGMVDTLGLINRNKPATGVERWGTIDALEERIDASRGVAAEPTSTGGLDIGAAVATSTLRMGGTSKHERIYQTVFSGNLVDGADTDRDNEKRNLVTIVTPKHGLEVDDYIQLEGGATITVDIAGTPTTRPGALPDGIVKVIAVSEDYIVVAASALLTPITADPPARGSSIMLPPPAGQEAGTAWRKVEGLFRDGAAASTGRTCSAANTVVGAAGATDYVTVAFTIDAADQIALDQFTATGGDRIFVKDSVVVEDGCYEVVSYAAGVVTINAKAVSVVNLGVKDLTATGVASRGVGGGVADAAAKITKVSGAAGNLETFPIHVNAGENKIYVYFPSGHSYALDSVIKFTGLGAPIVKVGAAATDIQIEEDKLYTIKAVTDNSIMFEVFAADGTTPLVAAANYDIGYNFSATTGVPAAGVAAAGVSTSLGDGAVLNYMGSFYDALGIATTAGYFSSPIPSTYSATTSALNMVEDAIDADFIGQSSITDSKGVKHQVFIKYLRISNEKVAVEICADEDDVEGDRQIAHGFITFDGDGELADIENALTSPLTFIWKNGATPNTVTFKHSMTQYQYEDNVKAKSDGHGAGIATRASFTSDGLVIVHYSNDEAVAKYQLPLAICESPANMKMIGSLLRENHNDPVSYVVAGTTGGTFVPGALRGSNVSTIKQLTTATIIANFHNNMVSIFSSDHKTQDFALNHLV